MELDILHIKKSLLHSKIAIFAVIVFLIIVSGLLISISSQLNNTLTYNSDAATNFRSARSRGEGTGTGVSRNEGRVERGIGYIAQPTTSYIDFLDCEKLGDNYSCMPAYQCEPGTNKNIKCNSVGGSYDPGWCCKRAIQPTTSVQSQPVVTTEPIITTAPTLKNCEVTSGYSSTGIAVRSRGVCISVDQFNALNPSDQQKCKWGTQLLYDPIKCGSAAYYCCKSNPIP